LNHPNPPPLGTPVIDIDVAVVEQVMRIRRELASQARRADARSLGNLLSVGDIVRISATTANRRFVDEVTLAQPATLTVPSPALDATTAATSPPTAVKMHVLTYRGGRVDSLAECVPCAYDYAATRRRIDVRLWQLSGIG